jgi:hypothetical protein
VKRFKETTSTCRVMDALVRADDFMTSRQLQAALGLNCNRVSAALFHLRKYKAAEAMEADGTLWWFATPDADTRTRVVEERTPECRRRNRRRKMTA